MNIINSIDALVITCSVRLLICTIESYLIDFPVSSEYSSGMIFTRY
jgi:hypothetical protein